MPLITSIIGVIGTVGTFFSGLGAFGTFALNAAVGVGMSLVSRALADKPKAQANRVGGVQGTLQAAGDIARSFPLGYSVTAGSLVYANFWGKDGETPNAYFTQVIAVSDLPTTIARVYVNGELVAFDTASLVNAPGSAALVPDAASAAMAAGLSPFGSTVAEFMANYINSHGGAASLGPDADKGVPVLAFRKDGKDHLWIKFHDGTQTTADTFLSNAVSNVERPWGPDRIGKGVAYAICTALVNDELFSGFPRFRFALNGIKLYDPSKDSAAGGSGAQRWSDPSTWGGDGDNLPAVQAYNVLRGVTYGGQWVYGLQRINSAQLPSAAWINAIAACRAPILGKDGYEPTYRAGMELSVSGDIADAVDILVSACQGRLSEVGGIYKMHAGQPGAPILSFADGDIIATEEQSFTPFLGLSETVNGITASYPEPAEGWATKTAPPLLRADLEVLDGHRRLLSDVKFDAVPYAEQVQRLMKSALLEAQRARRHTFVLPPMFWLLEPGDVVAWTSARNGYVAKLFRVDGVVDKANLDVIVDLTEVDPSDYDWDHAIDFRDPSNLPVQVIRPPPQGIVDWFAEPAVIYDEDGLGRRPAIRLAWDGTIVADIAAVQFEVRGDFATKDVVYRGRSDNVSAGSVRISQNLLPNTAYEVRGRYIPRNPRDTLWSDWIDVLTPDIRISEKDIVQKLLYQLTEFENQVDERILALENALSSAANAGVRSVRDNVRLRGQTVKMVDRVEAKIGDSQAAIEEVRELAVSNEGAIASLSTSVTAQFGTANANITTNAEAIASLDVSFSSYQVTVNAQLGSLNASVTTNATAIAGIGAQYTVLLDNNGYVTGTKQLNGGPGLSSFTVITDTFQVAKPGATGGAAVPVFTIGSINGVQKIGVRGDMLIDGSIIARHVAAGSITADKIQAGSIDANLIKQNGVALGNIIADAVGKVRTVTFASAIQLPHATAAPQWSAETVILDTGGFSVPAAATLTIDGATYAQSGSVIASPLGVSFRMASEEILRVRIYVDGSVVNERDYRPNLSSGWYGTSTRIDDIPMVTNYTSPLVVAVPVTSGTHRVEIRALWRSGVGIVAPTFSAGGIVVHQHHKTTLN